VTPLSHSELAASMVDYVKAGNAVQYATRVGTTLGVAQHRVNRATKAGIIVKTGSRRIPQPEFTDYGRLLLEQGDAAAVEQARPWRQPIMSWAHVDDSWMEGPKACRGLDTRTFFPEMPAGRPRGLDFVDPPAVAAARAVCARCPLWRDCLRYAVDGGISDGIWGGHTPREREVLQSGHGESESFLVLLRKAQSSPSAVA
jgi:WhiB family redox-sensing transcriptional regulator